MNDGGTLSAGSARGSTERTAPTPRLSIWITGSARKPG